MTQPEQPQPGSVHVGLEELVKIIAEQIAGLPQHQHQWAVTGVSYPDQSGQVHPRSNPPENVTFVAIVCHCGEPKSVVLDGHWEMSQLMLEIGKEAANGGS